MSMLLSSVSLPVFVSLLFSFSSSFLCFLVLHSSIEAKERLWEVGVCTTTTWTTTTTSKTQPHLHPLTAQLKKVEWSTTISPSDAPQHLEGLSDRYRPLKLPCTLAGFTLSKNKNHVYTRLVFIHVCDEVDFWCLILRSSTKESSKKDITAGIDCSPGEEPLCAKDWLPHFNSWTKKYSYTTTKTIMMESTARKKNSSSSKKSSSSHSKRHLHPQHVWKGEEPSLLLLSDETLLEIMQYLDAIDLSSLAVTCSRMRMAAYDNLLWQSRPVLHRIHLH